MGAEGAAAALLEADGFIRLLVIGLHHVHPRLVLVHGVDNDLDTGVEEVVFVQVTKAFPTGGATCNPVTFPSVITHKETLQLYGSVVAYPY